MSVESVSFQPVPRDSIPKDETCQVCREDISSDSGKACWGHANVVKRTELVHFVCMPCLQTIATTFKKCPQCRADIDQNSLPAPSFRQRIGSIVYSRASQMAIPAVVMAGALIGAVTGPATAALVGKAFTNTLSLALIGGEAVLRPKSYPRKAVVFAVALPVMIAPYMPTVGAGMVAGAVGIALIAAARYQDFRFSVASWIQSFATQKLLNSANDST